MENTEKLRVLLQHWIDHNEGHAKEFSTWQNLMQEDGKKDLAAHIEAAIKTMDDVNKELGKALDKLGGASSEGGHHHHHHHHHDH